MMINAAGYVGGGEALRQALEKMKFDATLRGARLKENSRAKNRIFSHHMAARLGSLNPNFGVCSNAGIAVTRIF